MREYLPLRFLLLGSALSCCQLSLPAAEPPPGFSYSTRHVRWTIGANGSCREWRDVRDQQDYGPAKHPPVATVLQGGEIWPCTGVTRQGELLELRFGAAGAIARLRITAKTTHLLVEVVSLEGEKVEEFTFVDLPLTLQGQPDEPLACCALALNLKTNVAELPQPSSHLRAISYARFGFPGAQVALIACPPEELRAIMQEVVSCAPELPKSPLGGPWALDQPSTNGSTLFNFWDLSEGTVGQWIDLAKRLGIKQIDFHGGKSFRFGDCRPNPELYPRGFDSLKAVVDRLHAEGLMAGLHTYAFFLAKDSPWVTPVPDPRLAKDAVFTLSDSLLACSAVVPVVESTEKMSPVTGSRVRNSVTLQIDDELIVYAGVTKSPPFQFTACHRGAYGTKMARHAQGAKVYHLKECFGLFVPEADSSLLTEVAAATADAYNRCGFDMLYLDALDGEDILAGKEWGWHYGSRFAFEVHQRLQRPALMEMSTFHHHLWYLRSRYCTWDHPNRGYKKFIDLHLKDNLRNRRMFMPGSFGWWALKGGGGSQEERTFPDDIEYLMGKCLGMDTGMALLGIDPKNVAQLPALPGLANIIRRYEDLRHSGKVSGPVKERLRQPGAEFSLVGEVASGWQLRPARYTRHRVQMGDWSRRWQVENPFERQRAGLRIEALMSCGPYDTPGNRVVSDFAKPEQFSANTAPGDFRLEWRLSREQVKFGDFSACYAVTNPGTSRRGAWTRVERCYDPPLDLSREQALGLWVHGDGQKELLNVQLRSPQHLTRAIGDHYIPVDFNGWRYFELIEPEGERHADHVWPYGGIYAIYRNSVAYRAVASLGLWYNNLPPGKRVNCFLSPLMAMPLRPAKLVRPALTIGNQRITFPVEIESGSYLECRSSSDCYLYGPDGQPKKFVPPEGVIPWLEAGENEVYFHCEDYGGVAVRANVTLFSFGEPLP